MSTRRILCAAAVVLALGSSGTAGQVLSVGPMEPAAPALAQRAAAQPARRAEVRQIAPLAELEPARLAAREQLEAMADWNRQGRLPVQNGFIRPLSEPLRVVVSPPAATEPRELGGGIALRAADGGVVWSAVVKVAEAYRLRLELDASGLPPDAQLWVWGASDPVQGPFGLELAAPDGTLWTPSVDGGQIHVEVAVPGRALAGGAVAALEVRAVAELFAVQAESGLLSPKAHDSCLTDATCIDETTFEVIDLARRAVAHLQFVVGASTFACTGALLNNLAQDGTPYLLTANHCFETQAAAASLEAFWDFKSSSCDGSAPSLGSLPRSSGATLLATAAATDFTFVELNGIPSNRVFLGWNADPSVVGAGTVLHRISHPIPHDTILPQSYTQYEVNTVVPPCGGAPRPEFLYSEVVAGGSFGGSSGAPVILANGQTVGQLRGACGPSPEDGCDARNHEVDGAFSATFPSISEWLVPDTLVTGCLASDTVMCLNNDRFQVEVFWRDSQGQVGTGEVVPAGSNDSGLFWFFDPNNWEILVKVLNACDLPEFNTFWVFAAATTDVEYTLRVTDTQNPSEVRQYVNPLGTPSPAITDTNAFATCP